MQAGDLDNEVKIYTKGGVKNSFGEVDYEETLFDTDWAKIEPLTTIKDNERVMNSSQLIAFAVYRFTFRYRLDITPKMIFVDEDGGKYEVVSEPIFIGRRAYVTFNAERRNNDRV